MSIQARRSLPWLATLSVQDLRVILIRARIRDTRRPRRPSTRPSNELPLR